MAATKVKVNNYIENENNLYVDPISKTIIKTSALFGLNRTFIFFEKRRIRKILVSLHTLIIMSGVLAVAGGYGMKFYYYGELVQYLFCSVNCFVNYKRLSSYFREINNFDIQVGRRPRISYIIRQNVVLYIVMTMVLSSTLFLFYPSETLCVNSCLADLRKYYFRIIIRMSFILEMFFFGHLLCLICPRIKLINYYMESALSHSVSIDIKKIRVGFESLKYDGPRKDHSDIKYLMDLYMIIVDAYHFLIDAMQWQFLTLLLTSLIVNIFLSFVLLSDASWSIFPRSSEVMTTKLAFSVLGNIFSLFGPSIYGDKLYTEVERLKMILSLRLHEKKMDKDERTAARALLSLTQEHNLSLSLLGMLKVDISLPIKYISLLVTYLIIVLQFQKVIKTDE